MDLSTWFYWVFASPGYFFLALVGLIVFVGLIAGLTDSRIFDQTDTPPPDDNEPHSGKPWWQRDEEHYRQWNAFQVRERHRTAREHSSLD